jgi:hypothetical protein
MKNGPRKRGEPVLIGAAEAAEICGTASSNLGQIVGLPEPYDKIRASTLYRRNEVERFAEARNERLHRAA